MKPAAREGKKPAQKTLYAQLLARSLFVLAALLLLIGGFQYFLMRGFLYQNQAETLEAQFRSIPPFLIEEWRSGTVGGQGAPSPAFGANPGEEPDVETKGPLQRGYMYGTLENGEGAPPFSDEGEYGGGSDSDGDGPDHRAFLLNGLSLAAVDAQGRTTDLNAEYGVPAPVLTPVQYTALRARTAQPGGRVRYTLAADGNGSEQLLVVRPAGGFGGGGTPLLQIGIPTGPLTAILWRQLAIFAALSALALAGGFALYRPVLRRSLSPLSRMGETVKEIDAGRLGERFPAEQGQAEIDRLASSFNGMLERLEEAFAAERESQERMRRFIADASHELRTPLTSIRGFLEVLLRGSRISEEQLRAALRSMHGESERMTKLVEDLLLLVKLDRKPELERVPLKPAALLRELESHLRMLAGERRVILDTEDAESAEVSGDPDKLKQVMLNLFANAVQHTDPVEGEIVLALSVRGDAARIEVRDNGPGIPPELRRKVFERFYRGDESRSRRSGGAGLGLAISLSIAEAHGGTLELDSVPGRGSTFRLVLPLG
ncbi:sensor histidine kinase [Saccharibacillus alkalitolerans]|uniref:histidine kinase n=1 Tax=Saccharibacillus alkalitolerans TaxID=2705290 RepID=A0ABX0F0T5_9BACL|nr:HAMP domain-containing sensor histidine kinase [Saccharibacillus alkalitolerans]NGZ74038.1 HAMP domain-containing histidine kinase [Saccharibacillus alkalitolerans]